MSRDRLSTDHPHVQARDTTSKRTQDQRWQRLVPVCSSSCTSLCSGLESCSERVPASHHTARNATHWQSAPHTPDTLDRQASQTILDDVEHYLAPVFDIPRDVTRRDKTPEQFDASLFNRTTQHGDHLVIALDIAYVSSDDAMLTDLQADAIPVLVREARHTVEARHARSCVTTRQLDCHGSTRPFFFA